MENYLSSLVYKRGKVFWSSYKTLLNTKHEEVGLIRSKEGRLLYAQEEISKEFETRFFGGEHLKKQVFIDATQQRVEAKIYQAHDDTEHDNDVLRDGISIDEMKNDNLKPSNTKSFDIDGLHVTMIKNSGTWAFLCWIFSMLAGNIMCGHGRSHESS